MGDFDQRRAGLTEPRTCPKHPDALVRRFRVNGPGGPTVYLQCVPLDAAPHLLGEDDGARVASPADSAPAQVVAPATLPRPGLVARAEVQSMPDAPVPAEGDVLAF